MLVELMMDEGFEIGWNYFEPEPLDDEDVKHFEKVRSKLIYHKGVLVSKKPGLDKRGRLLSRR
jgi:hypothetical protein